MEFTIIVLKVFAIYLIVSGAFLLFKGKTLPLLLRDFFEHSATVYLTGVILVFLGSVLLVQYDRLSDETLPTVVWILGVMALVKGLTYIFFPKVLADFPIKQFRGWLGFIGIVLIVAGIYLFRIG